MTEKEFLGFMEKAWSKGRISQVSGRIDSADPEVKKAGEYLCGHALLPRDYDKISEENLIKMANLLFRNGIQNTTKEIILIIFTHQGTKFALSTLKKYCLNPDRGLEYFSKMALDECEMWSD